MSVHPTEQIIKKDCRDLLESTDLARVPKQQALTVGEWRELIREALKEARWPARSRGSYFTYRDRLRQVGAFHVSLTVFPVLFYRLDLSSSWVYGISANQEALIPREIYRDKIDLTVLAIVKHWREVERRAAKDSRWTRAEMLHFSRMVATTVQVQNRYSLT